MQKLSACRKRPSPIQRFSSTRMRCITAIWPAGPPKLSAATRAQVQNASRKEMGSGTLLTASGGVVLCGVGGTVSADTNKLLRQTYAAGEAELGRLSSDG